MAVSRTGSIYVREPEHMLETGYVVEGHLHNFDHTTFFIAGLWHVECYQGETDKLIMDVQVRGGTPGARLLIRANDRHRLTLLEGPGNYACVYSHRVPNGEVVPEWTGWMHAYDKK